MAIVPPIVTDLLLCMVGEGEVEGKRRTAAPGIRCWKESELEKFERRFRLSDVKEEQTAESTT
jgi:hypothetical protein